MTVLLDIKGLSVGYSRKGLALQGVDLAIGEREVVALLGTNGAGKTTVIRAVSGLLDFHHAHVSGGEIRFRGTSLLGLPPHRRVRLGLGQVPEGRMVFKQLTVEENLRLGASMLGAAAVREGLPQVYELFPRLHERRQQVAGWMSGGEQQMLALGRAIMGRPKLMLIDELSLGLAPLVVESIYQQLASIVERFEMSVLVVEQNAHVALAFASRAYVLERGRVVIHGSAQDVAESDVMHASYLGAAA